MTDIREYLPDPIRGLNQTPVFIKVWPTVAVPDVRAALSFLQTTDPQPVRLRSLPREKHLTVVVNANDDPRIEFGRSVPTGDAKADFEEIISVLKANGIEAIQHD